MVLSEDSKPFLFSFITVRPESFGAILFNPVSGGELELDPFETHVAGLCDGGHSIGEMEESVRAHFRIGRGESRESVNRTVGRLLLAMALSTGKKPMLTLPRMTTIKSHGFRRLSAPKRMVWDVTYACDLKCPHCVTSSGSPGRAELDTEGAIALIERMAEAKVFTLLLSGGEPFLRPDILDLLDYLSGTNLRVQIATNGLSLKKSTIDALVEFGISGVQVSIDGIGSRHDEFRGRKGAFDIACRTICRLVNSGISTSVNTAVTAQNLEEIDEIIDLAQRLGCKSIVASPFVPAGRGRSNISQLRLDMDGYRSLYRTLAKRSAELKGKLSVSTEMGYSFLIEKAGGHETMDVPAGCSAGNDTLAVGADGMAYPCPFLRDFPLGNIIENPIQAIWESAPALEQLRSLRRSSLQGGCAKCGYGPEYCMGGCRARAYYEYGSLTAHDPACIMPIVR